MLYRCQPGRCRYTVAVAIGEVHAPTSGTTVATRFGGVIG
jgi:hypothetical protein